MRFAKETVKDVEQDILPLIEEHYQEIAEFKDIPLHPNFDFFRNSEKANLLRIFTARDEQSHRLTGYAIFIVAFHPHYQTSLQARADLLYVDPIERGFGHLFLTYCDQELKKEGVEVIYHSVTSKLDYGLLLRRAGYQVHEMTYSRRL